MTVLMVRYEVEGDRVAEVEADIQKMIMAIEEAQPKGTRYALGKLSDGVTFVGILELEDGVDNPLPGIAAARELQVKLQDRVVGQPPTPEPFEVVGSYRLFD